MNQASFNFHGVKLTLWAHDSRAEQVLKWLAEDFFYFQTIPVKSELQFHLRGMPAPIAPGGLRLFKTRTCSVYGLGRRRICDYGEGTLVESENWNYHRRRFNVFSAKESELYEFAYVGLLSVIGEALDQRGFHRVHALAVASADSAVAVLLPQGGGKSSMATQLLRSPLSILSDESPLIKKGVIYPFPNHIALAPDLAKKLGRSDTRLFKRKCFPSKSVFSVPREKVSQPLPLKALMIGRKWDGKPSIRKISAQKSFAALFRGMVVGEGLAQMAEFMLRGNNTHLMKIGLSRLVESLRINSSVPCYEFMLSPEIEENALALLNFT